MTGVEDIMNPNKIPSEKIDWVKENWSERNFSEVMDSFKEWDVIGNICGECGLQGTVDQFIKYWVKEGII